MPSVPHASPTPNLAGVDAKIARAKEHMGQLEGELKEALRPERQTFTLQQEGAPGHYALRCYGVPPIDPRWSTIVGDIVYNLRSALDHLVWQLVLLDGGVPNSGTQFKMRRSPVDSKGRVLPLTAPEIARQDIREALESVQPYRGMDGAIVDPTETPLWKLDRLCNTDKHRLLLVMVCALDLVNMWWGSAGHDPQPRLTFVQSAAVEGGVVGWFDFQGGAKPPAGFDPHPALEVFFQEPDVPYFPISHLRAVLKQFLWVVEDYVVNYRFRQFF